MKTIDASSLINLYSFPEYFEKHKAAFDDELIAPAILIPEFLNGIRKMVFRKEITRVLSNEIVQRFAKVQIELFTLIDYRAELWSMTQNFTPYDATYVLLANTTNTPLLTSDARLAKAASRSTDVILLE